MTNFWKKVCVASFVKKKTSSKIIFEKIQVDEENRRIYV